MLGWRFGTGSLGEDHQRGLAAASGSGRTAPTRVAFAPMGKLVENLAESVPSWGAKVAYGEKTTIDGQEAVPVAFVVFGFGGGEGSGDMPEGGRSVAGHGEGSGGGGGGFSVPIGAYINGPDGLRFRANTIALLVAAVPVVSAIGGAIALIVGASKVGGWRGGSSR